MGDKLKKILWLPLGLLCAIVAVVNVTHLTVAASCTTSCGVMATTDSQTSKRDEYFAFFEQVAELTSQHSIDKNAVVFFDKTQDLATDDNGNYVVTEQTFTDLTGIVPNELPTTKKQRLKSRANDVPVYDLNELAAQTGYHVTSGAQNMILSRSFAAKRLMIYSTTSDLDPYGAVGALSYGELHIHQYATEVATSEAYNYYLTRSDVTNVCADSMCWVEDTVESINDMVTLGWDDSFSYYSWGAKEMGVSGYSQYLTNTVKAVNNDFTALPEVVVAVLDTGIDTDHPWFKNRLLVDENGKYIGKNYTDKVSETEYDFEDDQGHGTHCAGIIRDMTLSNVKILPLKFMQATEDGRATGSTVHALLAVTYCMQIREQYNLVAINMSFGSESTDDPNSSEAALKRLIESAYQAGIYSVAAAGNESENVSNHSPGNCERCVTVSALKNNPLCFDTSYSNFGDLVDVCAPGTSIESAYIGGGTATMSGTSMATPHVVAYIALLKSDPTHNYSMTDIDQILMGTYDGLESIIDLDASANWDSVLATEGKDQMYGYGMPTLAHAYPDYLSVDVIASEHGTTSLLGYNIFPNTDSVTITFTPDYGYRVENIYINGIRLYTENDISKEFTFTNKLISHDTKIKVEFAINQYLIIATAGEHGTITPVGEITVAHSDNVVFHIEPEYGYRLSAIKIDDVALTRMESETQYILSNVTEPHSIAFEFVMLEVITYTVNHYWEPIYDLSDIDHNYKYELHESETLSGYAGLFTEISAKNYPGFTAQEISQRIIETDLVMNIFYTRNIYTLTVDTVTFNESTQAFASISGTGNYLFGSSVELVPTMKIGFENYLWSVDECDDAEFLQNFNTNSSQQSFTMPASNLTLTAYANRKTFLITIQVEGNGKVSPKQTTVKYGDSVVLEFTPDDGYEVKTVYRDGIDLKFNRTSYPINAITASTDIKVVFDKQNPTENSEAINWTDIIIWGGGGLIAVILFGSSAAMLIIAFTGKKTVVHKTNQTPVITPENRLLVALEYITGRESDFINFCHQNQIDYKSQYRQSVIQFYNAHHKDN
ncbi:MAG: S8 family serine peptidase [Prevotella sp.]|nr:S8 family serine peptidase [Prevotella sp.]